MKKNRVRAFATPVYPSGSAKAGRIVLEPSEGTVYTPMPAPEPSDRYLPEPKERFKRR